MSASSSSPSEDLAARRSHCFDVSTLAGGQIRAGQVISSHALLLEVDLRLAYCAGAWLSVIVLASAAVEAQARQVTANTYASTAESLFADGPDLQWLRILRNELVHAREPGSRSQLCKVDAGNIGANQAALESEATRAVEVMFHAIYATHKPQRRNR